jgi:hypothetical protein
LLTFLLRLSRLQVGNVGIETSVGLRDELTIEPLLTTAGLVATAQYDRCPLRIESEGEPPDTVVGVETQFLHVLVPRAVQRVDAWTPELRSEGFKNGDVGQQFVLDRFRQGLELGNKLRMQFDVPRRTS